MHLQILWKLTEKYYYVDSVDVPYTGCETMVFSCDAKGNVHSWQELFCEHYHNTIEMKAGHERIVANLGDILAAYGY